MENTLNPEELWQQILKDYSNPGLPPITYDFGGMRVLLTEDNDLNREVAYELLADVGIQVETAVDGMDCVKQIAEAPADYFDLILMDIQMPNMNGIDAAKAIRALSDEKKAAIPIIAMTANIYEQDRREAFAAGMNDFTEKPIRIDQLFDAIARIRDAS